MSQLGSAQHVAVVGGGVIGMSTAWRLADAGYRVTLIDDAPASGSSWVAGGMLAPVAEAWPGEEALLELGAASLSRWPSFAARLAEASGQPSGLREEGTLVVGVDGADRAELDRLAEFLGHLGREVARYGATALRQWEPSLGPAVRGGLSVPGDLAVDNRITLAALQAALRSANVRMVAGPARAVRTGGVEREDSTVECDLVVVAAGAHSERLHPALDGRVRPVKGEILRLRARRTALPPPKRTVRGWVHGRQVYIVPRAEGVVIGATQYEAGYDTEVTVSGLRTLLADAEQLLPGIAEYALTEAIAGLRPATEDNLPLIGWLDTGVLVATGHHRNGFLLAPITADAVVDMARGEPPAPEVRAADPTRSGTSPAIAEGEVTR